MASTKGLALYHLMTPDSPWVKSPKERAEMTMRCNDADYIPRVKDAGEKKKYRGVDVQVMHNGLYVKMNGYQGEWQAKIIDKLHGVHEPQEEKAFFEVLKRLDNKPQMMELGSWWSYYSMWFLKSNKGAHAICCEPDLTNLQLGRENMALNDFHEGKDVTFYASAAGKDDGKKVSFKNEDGSVTKTVIRTVDSVLKEQKNKKLDVLHMDIQGAELDTLKGAEESIKSGKIRFIFISTHHYSISQNPLIHQQCIEYIEKHGGKVVAQHNILESCSGDGLIVASFDKRDRDFMVDVFRQPSGDSLFRGYEYDVDILWKQYEKLAQHASRQIEALTEESNRLKERNQNLEGELAEIARLKDHFTRQVKIRLGKKK